MAEKYGEIPKKFTRAWWDYFWMYYKALVIVIVIAILLVALTVYQVLSAPEYDLTITYAGALPFDEVMVEKIENDLSPLCNDVDKNGKKRIDFSVHSLSTEIEDIEYLRLAETNLQLAFIADEAYFYILDKTTALRYQGDTPEESAFATIDSWLESQIPEEDLYIVHGKAYGVSMSRIEYFNDLGYDFKDHYLFMRYYPRKDQMKKQLAGYEEAVRLANELISK